MQINSQQETIKIEGLKEGYVTLVDILGWKGIWRDKSIKSVVENLLEIENEINHYINSYKTEILMKLIYNQLGEFYNKKEDKEEINRIAQSNGSYTDIIDIGTKESYFRNQIEEINSKCKEYENTIKEKYLSLHKYHSENKPTPTESDIRKLRELDEYLYDNEWAMSDREKDGMALKEYDKLSPAQREYETKSHLMMMDIMDLEKKTKELPRKIPLIERERDALRKKYYEIFDKHKIELSVCLISDTFVITSESQENELEFKYHIMLVKELISQCFKKELLLRGATSYGEYYHKGMVFAGSAIDDAASWHELGEEVVVYLTPKGKLSTSGANINSCMKTALIFEGRPELKIKSFDTFMIDWSDSSKHFENIVRKYDTIMPEIANKIMNSFSRLKQLKG